MSAMRIHALPSGRRAWRNHERADPENTYHVLGSITKGWVQRRMKEMKDGDVDSVPTSHPVTHPASIPFKAGG